MQVSCATDTPLEEHVACELRELLGQFDLSRWRWTDTAVIEEGATPHSHPILTLGTFNRGPFLLASYLHEQLHWYACERMDQLEAISQNELLRRYPYVPVGLPDGAATKDSTYLHLFVCWWEVEALRHLLGRNRADSVVKVLIDRGVYRWVYHTIRDDFGVLGHLYRGHGLDSPLGS